MGVMRRRRVEHDAPAAFEPGPAIQRRGIEHERRPETLEERAGLFDARCAPGEKEPTLRVDAEEPPRPARARTGGGELLEEVSGPWAEGRVGPPQSETQ